MRIFALISLFTIVALTSCSVSILSNAPTPAPLFLTSTLPATNTPFPTPITPSPTSVPPTVNATLAACKERAVMVQDVTIPDDTYIAPGAKFTKTWRFKNTRHLPLERIHDCICIWRSNGRAGLCTGSSHRSQCDGGCFRAIDRTYCL